MITGKKDEALYLRVSSAEQREQKTIESQGSEVQKALLARDVKPAKIYPDDGVSSTVPLDKRPAGKALLEDAAAGRIGRVYIWKYDRLGRNLRDFLNLQHRLEKLGVEIESVMQPLPKGAAGRTMMQMLGAFAELDRENMLENFRRGKVGKVERDGWAGGPVPFGYRVEGVKPNTHLALHVANAKLVLDLFKEVDDTGKSCRVLSEAWNAAGIPTSRQNPGTLWRQGGIRSILTNPIYKGTRQWGKRQWVKVEDDAGNVTTHLKPTPERIITSQVPQIVPVDLWDRVQIKLKANQIKEMAHAKNDYLLRGLISCGICGCKYGGTGNYYACIGRTCWKRLHKDAPCPASHIRRKLVEEIVWDQCEAFISNPKKTGGELMRELEATPLRQVEDERIKEHANLERNDAAREKARWCMMEGHATKEEFQKDMQRLAEQRSIIEARLAELKMKSADRESKARDIANVVSVFEQLRQGVREGYSFEYKRLIVEAFVAGVTIIPRKEPPKELSPAERVYMDEPGWFKDDWKIDFKFHCEFVRPRAPHATDAQLRAGIEGLRIALRAIS